jgi:hypothetical protein
MLATDEKNRVLYHLNWPSSSIVENNTLYNSIIDDRLSDISNDGTDNVLRLLEELEKAEQEYQKSLSCLKVEQADGIRMNLDHRYNIRSEYRRLQKKLSSLLSIPINNQGSGVVIA